MQFSNACTFTTRIHTRRRNVYIYLHAHADMKTIHASAVLVLGCIYTHTHMLCTESCDTCVRMCTDTNIIYIYIHIHYIYTFSSGPFDRCVGSNPYSGYKLQIGNEKRTIVGWSGLYKTVQVVCVCMCVCVCACIYIHTHIFVSASFFIHVYTYTQ
jgi:hypothetical protein